MPVFAVKLSERLFGPILELVDKGAYQSLETFLEIAAYNQLALERAVTPEQLLARGHRHANGEAVSGSTPTPDSTNGRPETAGKRPKSLKAKKNRPKKGGKPTSQKPDPTPPS